MTKHGRNGEPRFSRFMGVFRWTLFVLVAILASLSLWKYGGLIGTGEQETGEKAIYHCPMHPNYISSHRGDCPICGMSLVPVKDVEQGGKDSDAGGGDSSPKDGEGKTRIPPASNHRAKTDSKKYICPMHPEVVADEPGKCPKCGMNLVPQSETKEEKKKIPGLENIHLSPERLQLIGLRTEPVARREFSSGLTLTGFVEKNERNIAKVHLRFSGWIQKLFASAEGDYVRKGAPLLKIYSQELYQTEEELLLAMRSLAEKSLLGDRGDLLGSVKKKLRLLNVPEE